MTAETNGHVVIDITTLTLGDLEAVEDAVGGDVLREISRATPNPKTLTALVWVVRRKTEPEFTLEDARATPLLKVEVVDAAPSPKDGDG